jgi:hypothetical protein
MTDVELPVDQTLRMVLVGMDPGGLLLGWASLPARTYTVQYKATLSSSSWTNIGTVESVGTETTFTDTNPTRLTQSEGFYRVIVAP